MSTSGDAGLGTTLRAARRARGLTQQQVVGATAVSQARLSRIENALSLPTEIETGALARVYGLEPDETAELVDLARQAHGELRDTRLVVQRGNTLALQQRWRVLETEASVVRSYQPVVVLGALQTAAYAAVALQQPVDSDVVLERLRRQNDAGAGRRQVLIQTEASLRQVVGSAAVMVEQLDAIKQASSSAGLDLGVIAATTALPILVGSGFHLYDDSTAVVGLQVAAATLTEAVDVTHFRRLFERLVELAVWGEDAWALLDEIAGAHRSALPETP